MIELGLIVGLGTLAVGVAAVLLLQLLPTLRFQLAGLAFLSVVLPLGAVLLSGGGRAIGFRPWHLALPLLSAVCFGVVAILRKLGLSGTGAVLGSAINVTTAFIAFTAMLASDNERMARIRMVSCNSIPSPRARRALSRRRGRKPSRTRPG